MHSEEDLGTTSDDDEDKSVAEPIAPKAVAGSKRKRNAGDDKCLTAQADIIETSEEEEEANAVLASSSKSVLKVEMAAHKAQLQALKEQDPEFYEYLQVKRGLPCAPSQIGDVVVHFLLLLPLMRDHHATSYSPQTRNYSTLEGSRRTSWTVTKTPPSMQQRVEWMAKLVDLQQAFPNLDMAASHLPWLKAGARHLNKREAWALFVTY